MNFKLATLAVIIALFSCNTSEKGDNMADIIKKDFEVALKHFDAAVASIPTDDLKLPCSTRNGEVYYTPIEGWTSGFFPGSLWYLYEYSKDEKLLKQAQDFTAIVEEIKNFSGHHDVGFMINNCYGHGYRLTRNPAYKDVIIQASHSLSKRYQPTVGCIMSWNPDEPRGWTCPVIVDNMMNLEMLLDATEFSGDSSFYEIAISHADKTMENHYRDDYSSWHVLDYDLETGEVRSKETAQGYSDESAWARGQSWGLYGFVMMYRETGIERYLNHAINIADFLVNHPNLPENKVPYWDYNASDIPDAYRDASAGAIMASALIELSGYAKGKSSGYLDVAKKIITTLSTSEYLAEPGTNGNFILKHSVGHLPANSQIDVPLNYADYYFLECLHKLSKLQKYNLNLKK